MEHQHRIPYLESVLVLLTVLFLIGGVWSTIFMSPPQQGLQNILWPKPLPFPSGDGVIGCIETAFCANELKTAWRRSLALQGWTALTASRMRQIDFLIDGKKVAQVEQFSPRPEIAAAWDRPQITDCGWLAILPLTGVARGKHILVVRAISHDGKMADLPALSLTLQ